MTHCNLQLAREQPSVVDVRATTDQPKPWLRTDKFDELTRRFLGTKPQLEIYSLLCTNKSSMSLYRRHKRPVSGEFIAAAMEVFPGVPTAYYVASRRSEVTA